MDPTYSNSNLESLSDIEEAYQHVPTRPEETEVIATEQISNNEQLPINPTPDITSSPSKFCIPKKLKYFYLKHSICNIQLSVTYIFSSYSIY